MKPLLRQARAEDAEALLAIYRPFVAAPGYCFETAAPSVAEFAERIRAALEHWDWLLAEADGEVLGYAYAGPHRARAAYRWSCEVSVYLAPAAQGRGLGRALYASLFERLAERGYCNALAVLVEPNPGSAAFHAAMGFRRVGVFERAGYKQDRWWNVAWWQRRLREDDPPPALT